MLFVTMANKSPFARTTSLSKWASGSPEDDLNFEPGRPKFARQADEKARKAVDNDWQLSKEQKDKALAKYKVGTKVRASGYAGVMPVGAVGVVKKILESTSSGAIRYEVEYSDKNGKVTARVLEASLSRYG